VVRDNQTGQMGSFEADLTLPEMKKAPLKMSSIVLSSMRQPSKKNTPWCASRLQRRRLRLQLIQPQTPPSE
jgi:hypothetical protein